MVSIFGADMIGETYVPIDTSFSSMGVSGFEPAVSSTAAVIAPDTTTSAAPVSITGAMDFNFGAEGLFSGNGNVSVTPLTQETPIVSPSIASVGGNLANEAAKTSSQASVGSAASVGASTVGSTVAFVMDTTPSTGSAAQSTLPSGSGSAVNLGSDKASVASATASGDVLQRKADEWLAEDPLSASDIAAVEAALGNDSTLVAGRVQPKKAPTARDPVSDFVNTDGSDVRYNEQDGSISSPARGNASPQKSTSGSQGITGDAAADRGLKAVDAVVNGGKIKDPAAGLTPKEKKTLEQNTKDTLPFNDKVNTNDGKAQLNALLGLDKKEANADPIGFDYSKYGNDLKAVNTAFGRTLADDATKAAFSEAYSAAMPVSINVSKPLSNTLPGPSDETMAKTKGTAPEYQAPDGVNTWLNGAIKGSQDWQNSGDGTKVALGAAGEFFGNIGSGLYNTPGNAVRSAQNLWANGSSISSEDVVQGFSSTAVNTVFGLPMEAGKAIAIATGSDPKDINRKNEEAKVEMGMVPDTQNGQDIGNVVNGGLFAWGVGKGTVKLAQVGESFINSGGAFNKALKSADNVGTRTAGSNAFGATQYNTAAMPGGDDAFRTTDPVLINRID